MQIIDAHHHLWNLDEGRYPWLQTSETDGGFVGDISALKTSYTVPDYRSDFVGLDVIKSVHIQAEYDADSPVAETQWLQEQAKSHGFPHAIVAYADFSREDVESTLSRHAEFANVRGIRQILSHHPDPAYCHADREYLKHPDWVRRIGFLKSYGLSFDLQIYPHQVPDALPVIDANPDTRFIINHALEPWSNSDEVRQSWNFGVSALAERSNTAIKISGFAMFLRPFRQTVIEPYVLHLIEAFGVDRCMFGSNFPVDKLHCRFSDIFAAFDSITGQFSKEERASLFAHTASKLYRL